MLAQRVARHFGTLLILAMPMTTLAGGDAAITLGTGPCGFDSRGVDAGIDLGALPLHVNAGYFSASSDGETTLAQANAGLDWQVSESVAVNLGMSRIDDDFFIMKGTDIGIDIGLNKLWNGKKRTNVNLAVGRMEYDPDIDRSLPAALLNALPEQNRYSIGLSQSLTESLTANLGYDYYDYTEDPSALARAIGLTFLKRGRFPPNSAFTVAAFPDRTWSAGLGWEVGGNISLDLSYSLTETVIGQTLKDIALGITHYGKVFTFGVSISRSSSAEVKTERLDVMAFPSSSDTYVDFRIGMKFD